MTYEEQLQEVRDALTKMDYSQFVVERVFLEYISDGDRVNVRYMQSVIGIYDFIKHTFID